MLEQLPDKFAEYCLENLSFDGIRTFPHYLSLPICIIDCIYSLRARYYSVTVPVIDRYAKECMSGNKFSSDDTLSDFVEHINKAGGCELFAKNILGNNQRLSQRNKTEICYELSEKLMSYLYIETLEDFKTFTNSEQLQQVICSVKGIGSAGFNYLFMLAGDSDRCKPDVHIHRCIRDACGRDIASSECQELFNTAIEKIHMKYPAITVRDLDNIIWKKYQSKA